MPPLTRKRKAALDAAEAAPAKAAPAKAAPAKAAPAKAAPAKAVKHEAGQAAHKPVSETHESDEASIITSETPVAGHEELDVKVEHARSGRSQCRVCKGEIEKGELRIGMDVEMTRRAPGHMATSWRHLVRWRTPWNSLRSVLTFSVWRVLALQKCFRPPAGMHVEHLNGMEALSKEEQAAVQRHMRTAGKAKPAFKLKAPKSEEGLPHLKTHPDIIAARGVAGRHAAAEQAQQHEHPGDERFQLTDDEDEDEIREKYQSMRVSELKEVLRANEQIMGGIKEELIERCVDGELNGGLPTCPTCGVGRLKVSPHDEHFYCPGYFDETAAVYVRCEFRAAPDKVARNPWVMPGKFKKRKKKAKRASPEDSE